MKKKISVYNDFKTGFLYKICIIIGIIFLLIFLLINLNSLIYSNYNIAILKFFYDISITNFSGIMFSFSILLIAAGLILYFFKRQFNKLAEIANEIEQNSE